RPLDLRRDPRHPALLRRRQPRLREPARETQRLRRDRPELPRRGGHQRLVRNRLPEALRIRQPPCDRRAAVLPGTAEGRVENRPPDRPEPGLGAAPPRTRRATRGDPPDVSPRPPPRPRPAASPH